MFDAEGIASANSLLKSKHRFLKARKMTLPNNWIPFSGLLSQRMAGYQLKRPACLQGFPIKGTILVRHACTVTLIGACVRRVRGFDSAAVLRAKQGKIPMEGK